MSSDLLASANSLLVDTLVDHWIPTEPNATRVRFTGGQENPTGEVENQTRDELELAAHIGEAPAELERLENVDRADKRIPQAVYLEDVLQVGDIVEHESTRYRVTRAGPAYVGPKVAFYTADLEELESGD